MTWEREVSVIWFKNWGGGLKCNYVLFPLKDEGVGWTEWAPMLPHGWNQTWKEHFLAQQNPMHTLKIWILLKTFKDSQKMRCLQWRQLPSSSAPSQAPTVNAITFWLPQGKWKHHTKPSRCTLLKKSNITPAGDMLIKNTHASKTKSMVSLAGRESGSLKWQLFCLLPNT